MGDWSVSKVKAGLQADATIPTSLLFLLVAGLGCLCGSVSVFTTKTSGVQHQIQDALVVFVDHFNLDHFSFVISIHQLSCYWYDKYYPGTRITAGNLAFRKSLESEIGCSGCLLASMRLERYLMDLRTTTS
jgi:hypothetical protein